MRLWGWFFGNNFGWLICRSFGLDFGLDFGLYFLFGDGLLIVDQIADHRENPDRWTENIALNEALKFVQDREKTILVLRYYEGKTQVEISQITGISQAQVSRIEKSAIGKLKKCLGVE